MNEQLLTENASPKQVLLKFYEAEANYMKAFEESGSASFDEMQATMDSEVILHQSPDLPFGGEYVGYKGYEAWAKAMAFIFDKLEVKEREFFEHGDKVIVVCRFVTRSRVNGSVQDPSHGADCDCDEGQNRRFPAVLLERACIRRCRAKCQRLTPRTRELP